LLGAGDETQISTIIGRVPQVRARQAQKYRLAVVAPARRRRCRDYMRISVDSTSVWALHDFWRSLLRTLSMGIGV
jgi:hypothetical protein